MGFHYILNPPRILSWHLQHFLVHTIDQGSHLMKHRSPYDIREINIGREICI